MNAPKTAPTTCQARAAVRSFFYRVGSVKVNTGETIPTLEYFSSFDIWQGTNANSHKEVLAKLIPLEASR